MKHRLGDLLDIPRLQCALDSLYISSKIPSAIIDNDGKVHTGSGWQDICTKFHRVHPEARKRCVESDTYIADHIHEANPSITYKCPHGLVDAATPIIIEGEHLGNVFTGQLFLEEPDLDSFRAQAKAFGFDEETYIEAVKKVPIIPERAFQENLAFVAHLTGMLAEMGRERAKEMEAGKRLRESEERYRSLFGEASDGIFIMSPDGKIVEVNESFARMHGSSTGELLGMNIKDLDTPETSRLFPERMRRILAGETLAIDVEHHHKDGHAFPMEVSANLVSIGGEPFIQCFHRDITERKLAEENLKRTIRLSQVLLDAFPCVALLLRPRTREIVASNAAAVKVGAVPGAHCYSTWGKREGSCPWCQAPAVWETGKGQHQVIESVGTCWDAHWIPVSEDLYMHYAFDITDRKRAEDELRASRKMIEEIINAIPVRVFWKDRNLGYLGCNSIFARDAGYTDPKEVIGKDDFQMGWREQAELYRADDRQVIESGCSKLLIEEPQTTTEGKTITLLTSKIPLRNSKGEIGGVIGTYYDITDLKRAEEEKVKLEGQLQQAMKMEAVGRLAGGVAHDFNNLLTVIIGNVALALMKLAPSDPAKGMLDEANKAAERATRLTQQLLAFSRKQIIEPKVQDINLLMAELNQMLTRLIGENIELKTIPGEDLGLVKVDAGQFEQILVNLAVNARDAMPDGGKVAIETSNAELNEDYCSRHPYVTPGRFVMVAVSDTGHGMSEEVKEHIFEPFFTTKPKGSGTGFGLSTTYGAVKQAGGSIEVYSEVGMGTIFKIYLPRVEGKLSEIVSADRPGTLRGGTETVLLVEDEEIVRKLAVRVLDELGYRVLQAGNGDEAIALALGCGERIDLLLTDVVMPGMSGRELANRLTQVHRETRVLFTSGYTDDAIVNHGVLDEGVSFIGKPYTPSALARKVREVLGKA